MDNAEDKEKRKNVILGYREIIEDAMAVQEQTERNRESVEKIYSVLDRADKLVGRVNSSDEAVLDAKVISISSIVLKQNAEIFDTNLRSYSMNVFSDNINLFLEEQRCPDPTGKKDWKKLAPFAKRCFKYRTPSHTCMYGTFQMGETVAQSKKVRTKKDKIADAKKKEPENVDKVEKQEDGIEETVHYILKTLISAWKKNDRKPICYFKLVVNPESFGRTVENIFHVSFLVKDGLVDISCDENEFPVIEPISNAVAEKRKKTAPEKNQIIMSINMEEWQELIEAFQITTPMIKPRNVIQGSKK